MLFFNFLISGINLLSCFLYLIFLCFVRFLWFVLVQVVVSLLLLVFMTKRKITLNYKWKGKQMNWWHLHLIICIYLVLLTKYQYWVCETPNIKCKGAKSVPSVTKQERQEAWQNICMWRAGMESLLEAVEASFTTGDGGDSVSLFIQGWHNMAIMKTFRYLLSFIYTEQSIIIRPCHAVISNSKPNSLVSSFHPAEQLIRTGGQFGANYCLASNLTPQNASVTWAVWKGL